MANLNPQIMGDVELLTNLYTNIYDVYYKLYKLDDAGYKDSMEYRNTLEELKSLIGLSSNIEDRLTESYDNLKDILDYLYGILEIKSKKACFLIGAFYPKSKMIIVRIANKLAKHFLEVLPQHTNENIENIEDLPDEVKNSMRRFNEYTSLLSAYLSTDMARMAITILDQDLNKVPAFTRSDVLWSKYMESFIVEDIENYFVKNNFQSEEHPFLIASSAKQMYQVTDLEEKQAHLNILRKMLNEIVYSIMRVDDIWILSDPKLYASGAFASYLLRSCMVELTEEEYQQIVEQIQPYLAKLESDPRKRQAVQLLKSGISNRSKDMNIPQIISISR